MAKSHPGLKLLITYLKQDFPWKKEYHCKTDEIDRTFSYQEVHGALEKLKKTDPKLFKHLSYRWMTQRSRSAIAQTLYMDSSTLKRSWDKALYCIQNWLLHGTPDEKGEILVDPIEPLDLIYKLD